jgi:predicted Rossmann fold flavoprotein
MSKTIAIVGGGAAGFFAAIRCAGLAPHLKVVILESSSKLLSKVRISGGGRCNLSHACYEPSELTGYYPRGGKELNGPFHTFSPAETVEWFESRGLSLKTEKDGRIFPVSDSSGSVIACLMDAAKDAGIDILLNCRVCSIQRNEKGLFILEFQDGHTFRCDALILAPGGIASPKGYELLNGTGHSFVPPVPSLFTFNIPLVALTSLMGISVPDAQVMIRGMKYISRGPLLITHWGMSGPAILKLSSVAARELSACRYVFSISVNWNPRLSYEDVKLKLHEARKDLGRKRVSAFNPFEIPGRLWEYLVSKTSLARGTEWSQLSNDMIRSLLKVILDDDYKVEGKTTFKDEFVTCGGVSLKEIDFKTMQSKRQNGLFFAGEFMDIDGLTGGFNFQAAWTTGYIAGTNSALYCSQDR